jgi:hypothetical protein
MKKKLYITGLYSEMTTSLERAKFRHAKRRAEKLGFDVVLPNTGLARFSTPEAQVVDAIFEASKCDAVAMLPDFIQSDVAKMVRTVSIDNRKPVYYFGHDGLLYPNLLV